MCYRKNIILKGANKMRAEIKDVVDGDTVIVYLNGKVEHVRLLRINTPEKQESGYIEASNFLKSYLFTGLHVYLEFEGEKLERDRYGRVLAYIYVNQTHVNLMMVQNGYAKFWRRDGEGRMKKDFEEAEKLAKENKLGLWE